MGRKMIVVHSQNIILSFHVALFAMADLQKRRQVGEGIEDRGFERVVPGRRAVQPLGLARVRDSDGRAKLVNAGSLRLGDALDRYGESRRPQAIGVWPPP